MRVLLINGSPHKNGTTFTALSLISEYLKKGNVDSSIVHIGAVIKACTNCVKCRDTGLCIFDDEVNKVLEIVDEYDGIIIGSPVYYAAPTGGIISFLNRLFQAGHKKLEYKPAASVAMARRAGTTTTIDVLNKYFLYNNMPIVPSNYWNGAFGMNGEELAKDIEGLQILENLAENMVWLLKSLDIAKSNKVNPPKAKEKLYARLIE